MTKPEPDITPRQFLDLLNETRSRRIHARMVRHELEADSEWRSPEERVEATTRAERLRRWLGGRGA